MESAALDTALRRIGIVFIVCLLLQVRVDGRLVLLPLEAAAMAWALWGLRPLLGSAEAERAWRGSFGSAVVAGVLGLVGLIPPVERGTIDPLVSILLLFGVISHCSLLSHWARRVGWADAVLRYERARWWCVANLVVVGVGVAALLVSGRRSLGGEEGSVAPGVVAGRVFEGPAVLVAIVVIAVLWIGALVWLQMANRHVRAGLREQPGTVVPQA